jgi:hypothetical protein
MFSCHKLLAPVLPYKASDIAVSHLSLPYLLGVNIGISSYLSIHTSIGVPYQSLSRSDRFPTSWKSLEDARGDRRCRLPDSEGWLLHRANQHTISATTTVPNRLASLSKRQSMAASTQNL